MPDDEEVEEVAARLGAALAAGRRVHLRYYSEKNGRGDRTRRRSDAAVRGAGAAMPYLDGWCLLREKRRTFRLDRVLALEVLDVPASPPAEADTSTSARACSEPSEDDMRVELELSGPGRWVAEYYPCESVSELGDGRLRVVLRTPDTGWVWRLALRLGEDGRVVSPPTWWPRSAERPRPPWRITNAVPLGRPWRTHEVGCHRLRGARSYPPDPGGGLRRPPGSGPQDGAGHLGVVGDRRGRDD